MFSDRRRLRRWAAHALFVWLFGIVMGVANACSLGESTHHRVGPEATSGIAGHDHGDERGEPANANCLDFCEKPSLGAPQLKSFDDGSGYWGPALPLAAAFFSVAGLPDAAASRLAVDSPHLGGGPPPRIAFQRLAL